MNGVRDVRELFEKKSAQNNADREPKEENVVEGWIDQRGVKQDDERVRGLDEERVD